jgi:hypothetical protein
MWDDFEGFQFRRAVGPYSIVKMQEAFILSITHSTKGAVHSELSIYAVQMFYFPA